MQEKLKKFSRYKAYKKKNTKFYNMGSNLFGVFAIAQNDEN